MLQRIRAMWQGVVDHFHRERDLNRALHEVREAAHNVAVSKMELDRVIQEKHNADQFEHFSRDARRSHW